MQSSGRKACQYLMDEGSSSRDIRSEVILSFTSYHREKGETWNNETNTLRTTRVVKEERTKTRFCFLSFLFGHIFFSFRTHLQSHREADSKGNDGKNREGKRVCERRGNNSLWLWRPWLLEKLSCWGHVMGKFSLRMKQNKQLSRSPCDAMFCSCCLDWLPVSLCRPDLPSVYPVSSFSFLLFLLFWLIPLKRYLILEDSKEDYTESIIEIPSSDRRDSALFTCFASNLFGKDSKNFQLLIQGMMITRKRTSLFPCVVWWGRNDEKKELQTLTNGSQCLIPPDSLLVQSLSLSLSPSSFCSRLLICWHFISRLHSQLFFPSLTPSVISFTRISLCNDCSFQNELQAFSSSFSLSLSPLWLRESCFSGISFHSLSCFIFSTSHLIWTQCTLKQNPLIVRRIWRQPTLKADQLPSTGVIPSPEMLL